MDRSDIEIRLRDLLTDDLPAVCALNESGVPNVNSLSSREMSRFARTAAHFRVAVANSN